VEEKDMTTVFIRAGIKTLAMVMQGKAKGKVISPFLLYVNMNRITECVIDVRN
jgi:hypothetical protein